MKILMMLASHDQLDDTGWKTRFWFEEFAAPYFIFKDADTEMTPASPKDDQPPLNPKSDNPDSQTEATRHFKDDDEVQAALVNTVRFSTVLVANYGALPYPGGHGPSWDLAEDPQSTSLIKTTYAAGRLTAAVCHASGTLCHAKVSGGSPLVHDRPVTDFTNSEEAAVGFIEAVPSPIEDILEENRGKYLEGPD